MKLALRAVLVSPRFLFRVEKDRAGMKEWKVDDFELASRLSYFLWSSMPDSQLLSLAAKSELGKPEILRAQVVRMLKDKRSLALAENFAGQWLGFEKMREEVKPDKDRFPNFGFSLRVAMYREPLLFFDSLVKENGSVLGLLDSNTTFLNEELARHYRVPGVTGRAMRRVTLKSPLRGGVLGMGSTLALTSMPLRTSPVKRGMYVLDTLMGTPPPPPPQDAGTLPADDKQPDGLTFRQRLELHRRDPRCANCHKRLDPLGFALENFDAVGQWRTTEHGVPVDSTGKLPDGTVVGGIADLKAHLMANRDPFARNLTEKMLAYALGRGVEYYDRPTVEALKKRLVEGDYRMHSLILGIAESYPFQYRRGPESAK